MTPELVAVVKHDCPVCDQLLPALDAAGVRIVSQSGADATTRQAERLGLARVPELDEDLELSERLDLDAVPALVLFAAGRDVDRVEGLDRSRILDLARRAGKRLDLDGLPEHRPGCAARNRDPDVAARLAVRAARRRGRLVSREVRIGEHEDVHEALFGRGITDGLPVVPPTPERVVLMLDGTSRHPRDLVGVLPPYDSDVTVEKVAVNAVMAGCTPEVLPVVLAAVEAACCEEFALQGVIATTHPAGPQVIVSGPLAERIGLNAAGNVFGQGARANLTIGRALQLVVRNVGGARPGEEDRAAHGQMGKVGSCFAERTWDSPWEPLHVERGLDEAETGVTLVAAEAPRVVIDEAAREPEALARSYALALESIAHPKARLEWSAVLTVGPEHGRVFRDAGWSKQQLRERLFALTTTPAGELVRGAGGIAEGLDASRAGDPAAPVPKFLSPQEVLIVHAGGDAGKFSMVAGGWIAGDLGSVPVTRAVSTWS